MIVIIKSSLKIAVSGNERKPEVWFSACIKIVHYATMFPIMLYVPSEYDHVPSFFGYSISSIFFPYGLCVFISDLETHFGVNGITVISSPYSTVIYSYDRTRLWPKIPVISQWNHPLYKSNHIYNQLSSGFCTWKITVFIGKSTITWQFSSSQTVNVYQSCFITSLSPPVLLIRSCWCKTWSKTRLEARLIAKSHDICPLSTLFSP